MMGNPLGLATACAVLPMQKQYVTKTITAGGMFMMRLHHIERGTMTPASLISSDMCAEESEPTMVNTAVT